MSPDHVKELTILGHHAFAQSIEAIKAIRQACDLTLGPAKSVIDRALSGLVVTLDVPASTAASLADKLADLGWIVSLDGATRDAGPPEPPEWYKRRKGTATVVRHLAPDRSALRIVVAPRDCQLERGDELVMMFVTSNIPIGAAIAAVRITEEGVEVALSIDEASSEILECFFAVGEELEVIGRAP